MTVADLTRHVRFIVNAKGNRTAVVLEIAVWEQILTILEDLEDAEELRCGSPDAEVIPWEQARAELQSAGLNR